MSDTVKVFKCLRLKVMELKKNLLLLMVCYRNIEIKQYIMAYYYIN